ncbi:hypothetical protein [uncultured Chitinophaga sp.]|jgi:hypothetical protein|uniref:hypothetical protein n=1 Tax=uncultured Chitinophaga sp. TaxID=339340 RepID=UPI002609630C|nr:hypothetical protein [uncultured Chitinophaga sp.]
MKLIKNTLAKEFPSLTELINCFESVKENGKREMIRADEDQLEKALIKVLNKYVEEG